MLSAWQQGYMIHEWVQHSAQNWAGSRSDAESPVLLGPLVPFLYVEKYFEWSKKGSWFIWHWYLGYQTLKVWSRCFWTLVTANNHCDFRVTINTGCSEQGVLWSLWLVCNSHHLTTIVYIHKSHLVLGTLLCWIWARRKWDKHISEERWKKTRAFGPEAGRLGSIVDSFTCLSFTLHLLFTWGYNTVCTDQWNLI